MVVAQRLLGKDGPFGVNSRRIWCTDERLRVATKRSRSFPVSPLKEKRIDGVRRFADSLLVDSTVYRYADFSIHPHHPHLILAIREDHTHPEPSRVVNTLVLIDAHHQHVSVLCSGRDFYAAPRWSEGPRADRMCWIEWDHPDMPWEGSELKVAQINLEHKKVVGDVESVAGKHGEESVSQPIWSPSSDDTLLFLCDRTGYLNLYRHTVGGKEESSAKLCMREIAQDLAEPAWAFGEQQFVALSARDALVAPNNAGERTLSHLNLATGVITPIKAARVYRNVVQLRRVNERQAVFLGATARSAAVPVIVTFPSNANATATTASEDVGPVEVRQLETSRQLSPPAIPDEYISEGETITIHTDFPPPGAVDHTSDLASTTTTGSRKVPLHCVLYPPHNPHFVAPDGELPPAIVMVHGGPTSRSPPTYKALNQYFTSRGFAILDVDCERSASERTASDRKLNFAAPPPPVLDGGSSGYGRAYAQRLKVSPTQLVKNNGS